MNKIHEIISNIIMAHFICEKLQELEEVCKSDELTLDKLREKIEGFPPPLCPKPYLPLLCENKNVTLEIVEYMLNTFPGVAGTKKYCPYSGETLFPLHLACRNENCPSTAVQLLVKSCPEALGYS